MQAGVGQPGSLTTTSAWLGFAASVGALAGNVLFIVLAQVRCMLRGPRGLGAPCCVLPAPVQPAAATPGHPGDCPSLPPMPPSALICFALLPWPWPARLCQIYRNGNSILVMPSQLAHAVVATQ